MDSKTKNTFGGNGRERVVRFTARFAPDAKAVSVPVMVTSGPGLKLQELRDALLTLHKTLLESERIGYEQAIGQIPSPNHFLHLVTTDPWFAWLRPLSRLIVTLDEALDAPEPPTPAAVDDLVLQVRRLLVASEEGDGFPRSYFEALQRDPDVVFAHAGVAAVFRPGVRSA